MGGRASPLSTQHKNLLVACVVRAQWALEKAGLAMLHASLPHFHFGHVRSEIRARSSRVLTSPINGHVSAHSATLPTNRFIWGMGNQRGGGVGVRSVTRIDDHYTYGPEIDFQRVRVRSPQAFLSPSLPLFLWRSVIFHGPAAFFSRFNRDQRTWLAPSKSVTNTCFRVVFCSFEMEKKRKKFPLVLL